MNFHKVLSADSLADFTDDDVLELQKQAPPAPVQKLDPWWEKFQYHLYDWNDPEFKKKNVGPLAYVPILLTQGYFMMVSPNRLEEMTRHSDGREMPWHAHVRYHDGEITGVYALRKGRVGFDNVTTVLAHRQLLGILECPPSIVGDHINRCGLDNRDRGGRKGLVNLVAVGKDINGHNSVRLNKHGLPPGVERIKKKDEYRYGGKVCIRHSKVKVVTHRSVMRWKSPEPAGRWYQNFLKRLHGRVMWASLPKTVHEPLFPPLKPEYRYKFGPTLVKDAPALELEATF